MKIAKNRFYKPANMGGLGLFDLKIFLDAQRIAWIKRAKNVDDSWKITLYSKCYGSIFNVRSSDFDKNNEPCLYTIVSSYDKFVVNYTKFAENYKDAYLFNNDALTLGLNDRRKIYRGTFQIDFFAEHKRRIRQLTTLDMLTNDGRTVTRETFTERTGLAVSIQTFRLLKGLMETARVQYQKNDLIDRTTVNIQMFLNRARKGSKLYRLILTATQDDYIPHNIVKFSNNMEINVGLECSKIVNSLWCTTSLTNSTRTFLFKLYNNILGYNNAVAHFVRNHSLNCTFCDIARNPEIIDETPLHLFYNCPSVFPLLDNIFIWVTGDPNFELARLEFFTQFTREGLSESKNTILSHVSKLIQKFIRDSKQRYCLPNINHCKVMISQELATVSETNSKMKNKIALAGMNHILL